MKKIIITLLFVFGLIPCLHHNKIDFWGIQKVYADDYGDENGGGDWYEGTPDIDMTNVDPSNGTLLHEVVITAYQDVENPNWFANMMEINDLLETNGYPDSNLDGFDWEDFYAELDAALAMVIESRGDHNSGTDPNFTHGASPATPSISTNTSSLLAGHAASIGYTLSPTGVPTVTGVSVNLSGLVLAVSWTTGTTAFSVSGSVISFSVTGTDNYNIFLQSIGTLYQRDVTVSGTYDTSNGHYSIDAVFVKH